MSKDANRYLELLEQRTALLQSLSDALHAARAAVVTCDIAGFETRITQQESLCQEIERRNGELRVAQQKVGVSVSLCKPRENREWNQRLWNSLERLQIVRESVKRENECHQALVRRSKRTAPALLN